VCSTASELATLFLRENIDPQKLSTFSFASRKTPEFMCNHLVHCPTCDLVYADQPPAEQELAQAYHQADYDSSEEADDAAAAYIAAIRPILAKLGDRKSALEIGTGNGVFLEHLAQEGFAEVVGIEPSSAAIAAAPAHRRAWIREGIFRGEDYLPESFDLICCFMTMEHVRDPAAVSREAFRLLRPGGAFVAITHDYRGIVNRLLGKRSPIIDIEHMQLFSRGSVRYLLERSGYKDISATSFSNAYALRYWLRLAPIPAWLKKRAGHFLSMLGVDKFKLRFNVGNLIASGFKHQT
jgi:SAM-dependent methyltransferase